MTKHYDDKKQNYTVGLSIEIRAEHFIASQWIGKAGLDSSIKYQKPLNEKRKMLKNPVPHVTCYDLNAHEEEWEIF